MNPARFARLRDRIAWEPGRGSAWRKRALAHLVAEASAEVRTSGKRVLAYGLPDGGAVCNRRRYRDEDEASSAVVQIAKELSGRAKPIRWFACSHCQGWHITGTPRYSE
jgi:hypothetical protein